MTKWQESCITALASSPMAWEAFKMKQKNKKLLWQYINRVWPYKKMELDPTIIDPTINSIKIKDTINKIIELITLLTVKTEDQLAGTTIIVNIEITDIMPIIYAIPIFRLNISGNNLCSVFLLKRDTCITKEMRLFKNESLLSNLHDYSLSFLQGFTHIYKLSFCTGVVGFSEMVQLLKTDLLSIAKALNRYCKNTVKPIRDRYNWLNIGIEIEHFAEEATPDKIGKLALLQNCREYSFGYDGDMRSRLRENRLRLNGIKGLKGLYTLLYYMKDNCSIDTNSSLHIHVDCKYDNSYSNIRLIDANSNSTLNIHLMSTAHYKALSIIFNIKGHIDIEYFTSQIRRNSEFNTLEHRYGIPNFNYSDYVLQILTVIHITECLKHDKKVNLLYIEMIAKISANFRKEIRDMSLPVPNFIYINLT